jgi:hypothetical protein
MRNPAVDVLWNSTAIEQNVSEGESVVPLVWSRIVSYHKKPIFEAANNTGPGSSTVSDGAVGAGVIAVGAYIRSANERRHARPVIGRIANRASTSSKKDSTLASRCVPYRRVLPTRKESRPRLPGRHLFDARGRSPLLPCAKAFVGPTPAKRRRGYPPKSPEFTPFFRRKGR